MLWTMGGVEARKEETVARLTERSELSSSNRHGHVTDTRSPPLRRAFSRHHSVAPEIKEGR